jgi:hypothetical protein
MDIGSFFEVFKSGAVGGDKVFFIFIMIVLFALIFFAFKKGFRFLPLTLLFLIGLFLFVGGDSCSVSAVEINQANGGDFLLKTSNWIKINIYGCGQELNIFGRIGYGFKELLGGNQTASDFLWDFILGALAGLILYGLYKLIMLSSSQISKSVTSATSGLLGGGSAMREAVNIKNGWLGMIASAPWKVLVVGMFWAVVMQIPVLNKFLDLITFNNVFSMVDLGVPFLIRGFIIAFYFGLLPSFIEAYSRYRLRMAAYNKLIEMKYGIKTIRTAGGI